MKQEEIISVLAKEFDLDEAQIKLVIDQWWRGIRNAIIDPMVSKGNILLPKTMSFELSSYRIDRIMRYMKEKNIDSIGKNRTYEYYQELKDEISKHERKVSKTVQHERRDEEVSGGRSTEGTDGSESESL